MTIVPTEAEEQKMLFEWASYMQQRFRELELMYHVPNGGKRDAIEAAHMKQQGVKAGVPDICLPVARHGYHALYIELKRRDGGKLSVFQKTFLVKLEQQGNLCIVAKGAEAAANAIKEYLSE